MDVVTLGLVLGMANALLAVGLVLVYMSSRVINLAHGEIGAFAVAMMLALTRRYDWPYLPALLASLAAAGLVGFVIERSVLRRLTSSARLLVLIATIGVAQIVTVGRLVLPKPKAASGEDALVGGAGLFPVPISQPTWSFGRVTLLPQHFLVLAVGPLAALGVFWFLSRSSYGVALRAAAENPQRARLLGIPVSAVSALAWTIASVLSGLAAILLAPVNGFSATEAVGLPLLLRGLAAATVARFESVGVAFGVGLALGVLDQLVFFTTHRSGLTDLVLFSVILAALFSRRAGLGRAGEGSVEIPDALRPLPASIAGRPDWRRLVAVLTVGAVALVAAGPLVLTPSLTFLSAAVFLFAVITVSMTVLTGWAGQVSLGQFALAGTGGVFGARLVADFHQPFWWSLILAGLLGGAMAFVIGLAGLRLQGTDLAVVTLGFAVVSATYLYNQGWFRGDGILLRPGSTDTYYYVCLGLLVVTLVAMRGLRGTRVWRTMLAVRDNPAQAASMGVPVTATKLAAFVMSGALASLAGFLYAAGIGRVGDSTFPTVRSLSIVAAVVIGGLGSVSGAVLGSVYLLAIPYFGTRISPYLGLLSTGVGLLGFVLFLPGGLARIAFAGRDRLARLVTGIDPRPTVTRVEAEPAVDDDRQPVSSARGGP